MGKEKRKEKKKEKGNSKIKLYGLSKRINVMIGIPTLVIFLVVSLVLRVQVANIVEQSSNENVLSNTTFAVGEANEFFGQYSAITEQLATESIYQEMIMNARKQGVKMHENGLFNLAYSSLENCQATDIENVQNVFFASHDTNELISTGNLVTVRDLPDFVVLQRDWAKKVTDVKRTIYTEPYVDANSGKMVCSIVSPVFETGTTNLIGSTAIDLSLDELLERFEEITIGNNGTVKVFLPDGTVFFDRDKEKVGLNISELGISNNVLTAIKDRNENTVLSYTIGNKKMMGAISQIGTTGWTLLSCMPESEAMFAVNNATWFIACMLAITFAILLGIIILIVKRIADPLKEVTNVAEKMAQGNYYSELIIPTNIVDEIGELKCAFSKMLETSKNQTGVLKEIALGNFDVNLVPKSENDEFTIELNKVLSTLGEVTEELTSLTQEMILGNTSYRGNEHKFNGGYANVIKGYNATIDAIFNVLNEVNRVVENLGNGEIVEANGYYQGDYKEMMENLGASISNVNMLIDDVKNIAQASIVGNFTMRANAEKHKGEFKRIVEDFNKTLDTVVDKCDWYEAILEAVPIPVQVLDEKMNWSYMNEQFEQLIARNGGEDNKASYGKKCKNLGSPICNSSSCGVRCLEEQGNGNNYFEWNGKTANIKTSYLYDKEKNVIGYVETLQDISSIVQVKDFTEIEVKRLQENLEKIADGQFDFDFNMSASNDFTKETAEQFRLIDESLLKVKEAMGSLTDDITEITRQAIDGNLGYHADAEKHRGAYADVIEGINRVLDAVLDPISEASDVMYELAKGNLSNEVKGEYKGDHAKIKNALNSTIYNMRSTIDEIGNVLSAIGNGNLTVEISENFTGDYTRIKEYLENIVLKLKEVMQKLNETSEQVALGSKQLSEASQNLATGSTEQAGAIEELTATISDIASQSKQNADNVAEASGLALKVKENAELGNKKMQEMLSSMAEISEASANISKIIKVIDDIAFQTNILALNAAVESARAGVHGKGFAVVSEEVRNLAKRSADAVKETASLIESSVQKVEIGTKIANDTAEALESIVDGVSKASAVVEDIARATDEQTTAIVQVNVGIEQVSNVVQSNSATSEQSASSSEELYRQANLLKNMVDEFTLD